MCVCGFEFVNEALAGELTKTCFNNLWIFARQARLVIKTGAIRRQAVICLPMTALLRSSAVVR